MAENSKIEWTENTWSPWWGCRETSLACQNCYARRLARRFGRDCWGEKPRLMLSEAHWRKPLAWQRKAEREGRIIPVFPSMCDVFEDRPELVEPRGRLIRMIRHTPNLFWLLLTKRPENAGPMLPVDMLPNLGLGVTVENNDYLWRIAEVLKIPAALHFVSLEPLLNGLTLPPEFLALGQRAWCIAGCESGPKRRPTDIAHIRSLRDQCEAAHIPFLLKQMDVGGRVVKMPMLDGRTWGEFPEALR